MSDYMRCWDMFGEAGVDMRNYPSVGVGSVCRRQHTGEIREVLEALRDRDPEVPLHGYGVKTQGLRIYGDLLASADSLALEFECAQQPEAARLHPREVLELPEVGTAVAPRTGGRRMRYCARVVPAGDTMQIFGGIEPVSIR